MSLPELLRQRAGAESNGAKRTALILVWLPGGHSHLETYDPKPKAPSEYRGPFNSVATNVQGLDLCELLPQHAKLADKFSILRSVVHSGFCHQQGTHQLLTGHPVLELKLKPDDPDLFSIANHLRGNPTRELADEVGLLREILPEVVGLRSGIEDREPGKVRSETERPTPRAELIQSSSRSPRLAARRLLQEPSFELAFAVLLLGVSNIEVICRRLKLSNDELEKTAWLVRQQEALREADKLSLAKLKRLLAHPFRDDLLALTRSTLLAEQGDLHQVLFCERFLETTPPEVLNPPPLVTGNDLIELGLRPGPRFKQMLEEVRDAQLNGKLTDHAAALEWVNAQHEAPSGA